MRSKKLSLKGGSSKPKSKSSLRKRSNKSRNEVVATKVAQSYVNDFVKAVVTKNTKLGKYDKVGIMKDIYKYLEKEHKRVGQAKEFVSLQKKIRNALVTLRARLMKELGWGPNVKVASENFEKHATPNQKLVFPIPKPSEFFAWSKLTPQKQNLLEKRITRIGKLTLLAPANNTR